MPRTAIQDHNSVSDGVVHAAAVGQRLGSVRRRQPVTCARRKLLRREIRQLHDLVDDSAPLGELSLVRLLVCMATLAIERATDDAVPASDFDWEQVPPKLLREALRRLGPLETARFIKRLRVSGLTEEAVASILAWKDPRRVRQFIVLLQFPGRAKSLIVEYSLEERQLRPLVRWHRCAEIATLVDWLGKFNLSSREALSWCRLLKSREQARRVFPGLNAARECLLVVRPAGTIVQ